MVLPTKFDWEKLQQFCIEIFEKNGLSNKDATTVSESLVQANLRGVDSHGVVRTSIYIKRVEEGLINPEAEIAMEQEKGAVTLLNGQNHFGAVVGTKAMNMAIRKSKKYGAALVGVKGSNHFGTGAYYALKAIEQDTLLIVVSNASQTMPPTGGVRPFLGTNPLAVGVPAGKEQPFVLDMATSVVARGKIIVAAQKNEEIPLGWAIDCNGTETTDAQAALDGSVLPLGGAKGYGISMFIDILSGVLTGAGFGKYVNNMYENWNDPQNVGHFFIAIDINQFMPVDQFKSRMDLYIQEIKAEPKAPNVKEIFIPGEIEKRIEEERKKNGIALPEKLVEEFIQLGEKYGLNFLSTEWTGHAANGSEKETIK
ncbi:Ldh family oxidoreductase [Jeotgalibacillus proteolyticus]|uniref:Malate dehydrogenase n=1 Tax=Jeotgalibacillus proteolyticus TaxID=2082395 RepID=A0A2S5GBW4_9BACL|nr:Ldh family oxidoreductase [Jeotgalibacillus proteolyticus]PPA70405.1 malate dehydrogenase [Jeotgalibacillus proteolyticus]